jgi:4,5-dihydroxyphthalate decarboxylase
VARLFEDPLKTELDYFEKTGIFPAMHVLAIKHPLAEANPGLVPALFAAFSQAQKIARTKLYDGAALFTMLPWQIESLLFTEKRLGSDYWATGFAKNRTMLETIIRYMLEDGLTGTRSDRKTCSMMSCWQLD